MESNIQIFEKSEFGSVRAILIDNEPWFVAKDVCKALDIVNASDALSRVREKDRKPLNEANIGSTDIANYSDLNGSNGGRSPILVSESGLYDLVLGSRKQEALQFKYWIIDEVLPSIRKTGSYSVTPVVPLPSAFQDRYAIAKDLFSIVGIKGNQLVLALDKLYKHEAGYSLLEVTGTMLEAPEKEQVLTPTQIGQMLEPPMSAKAVNLKLMDMGYQHRIGDQLEPIGDGCIFAVMLDVGKAHSDGTPIRQLKWKSSILKNFR